MKSSCLKNPEVHWHLVRSFSPLGQGFSFCIITRKAVENVHCGPLFAIKKFSLLTQGEKEIQLKRIYSQPGNCCDLENNLYAGFNFNTRNIILSISFHNHYLLEPWFSDISFSFPSCIYCHMSQVLFWVIAVHMLFPSSLFYTCQKIQVLLLSALFSPLLDKMSC